MKTPDKILFGTGPVEEGGDGLPDGMPLYDALLAAKRETAARRAADASVTEVPHPATDAEGS